ncbi:MAG TPA: dihydrolipoamide acetyltransferase family protein [Acidimicrobiales bacterium]|nr:dihydrolipoamide acetyltransferase family protein [Acidimicrobiales bacterium]
MADITMPQLGETVTEGTITKWHKQVGDSVAEDEVLFEVSTDKVDSEVPSPVAGTVTEILVPEGETVQVGAKLAVIGDSGGAAGAGGPAASDSVPQPDVSEPAPPEQARAVAPEEMEAVAKAETGPLGVGGQTGGTPETSPGARSGAAPGAGGSQRPVGRPTDQRPPSAPGNSGPGQSGPGKLLSPVVRRLIAENNLDPARISGSGAGGRITRDDVLAAISAQGSNGNGAAPAAGALASPAAAAAPAYSQAASVTPSTPAPQPGERDRVVPFTNIRRRTAEHMVRSKQTSAHTMVAVEVDYSAVEKVRNAEKSSFKAREGFSLTYLPFISRAVVDALAEFPYLNSSVGEDQLIVHSEVNLGIAVDLDFEGLLVPVVHRAEEKRLVALARDISGLASRARGKRLTMDDISGGTFTLTNAGGFGTFITVPVINQPQVAILSTDGVKKRPTVVTLPDGSDSIAIHPLGNLVMSWDHRAVDGAYAAAFMAKVRDILETRDWAAEL